MCVTKLVTFNGVVKPAVGFVQRSMTIDDKVSCSLPVENDYWLVSFSIGDVEYCGAWAKSECY